jgi:transposase-like protein
VDKEGNTTDFLLRAKRDAVAAKAFFRKAFKENGRPDKITVDKSGSNKVALDHFNKDVPKEEERRSDKSNISTTSLNKITDLSRNEPSQCRDSRISIQPKKPFQELKTSA